MPPEVDPRLGTSLGGYVLEKHVADGAMGRVYRARPESGAAPDGSTRAAVKVLHPHTAADHVGVERFKREHETIAEFDHPNIVRPFAFGETGDGSWYLVMEYLDGEELGDLLRREGAQSLALALRIVAQIASALEHAHSFGVIHRDLKPDNVFLCRDPEGARVKILDFGSVKLQLEMGPKLTAFGTTLGSPYYMSPEQAMGLSDVDPRTDVFALAAIGYEILVGRPAFDGRSVAEILKKIVGEDPAPPSAVAAVPEALDGVFETGLRKDKEERFATAPAFAQALCLAAGVPGGAEAAASAPLRRVEAQVGAPPTRSVPVAPPTPDPDDLDRPTLGVDSWAPPTRPGAGPWVWVAAGVALAVAGALWLLLAG